METIINYINNLFLTLPDTPEVNKAKEDLTAMMEDKYNELIADGKKENEAIGIVIAEFGNLDELAEDLGLKTVLHTSDTSKINASQTTTNEPKRTFVPLSVAMEYVSAMKIHNIRIAFGVLLCIYSPIAFLILGTLSEENVIPFNENTSAIFGSIILFVLIGIAVAIFISSGTKLEAYDYLKKQPLDVDKTALDYIKDLHQKTAASSTNRVIVGVILCIVSVLPPMVLGSWEDIELSFKHYIPVLRFGHSNSEILGAIGGSFTLIIVGIAVCLFITSGTIKECYKVLTQDIEITKHHISQEKNPVLETIMSIFWSIVLIIYLVSSFYTEAWHVSWIIWPVAGILSGVVTSIFKIATKDC